MSRGVRRSIVRLEAFRSEEYDFQLLRALVYARHGAASIGECLSVARQIRNRDPESWTRAWSVAGAQAEEQAATSLQHHHRLGAREALLRAWNYHRAAEYYLSPRREYPRKRAVWQRSRSCFRLAASTFESVCEPVEIPFGGRTLPGYFACSKRREPGRPTLLIVGGADSWAEELYLTAGVAAVSRGYNALIFDGPGQTGALHSDPHLVFRPDYERPIGAAIDFALAHPEVDGERLAILGFSLGGYFAPRAAALDRRIRACIADAPIVDFRRFAEKALPAWLQKPGLLDRVANIVTRMSPQSRINLENSLWRTGSRTIQEHLERLKAYRLGELLQEIRCPTLSLVSEGEDIEALLQAREFHNGLLCQKTLRVFTAAEGAGAHCQLTNLGLMNQAVFDWLDELFQQDTPKQPRPAWPQSGVIGDDAPPPQ